MTRKHKYQTRCVDFVWHLYSATLDWTIRFYNSFNLWADTGKTLNRKPINFRLSLNQPISTCTKSSCSCIYGWFIFSKFQFDWKQKRKYSERLSSSNRFVIDYVWASRYAYVAKTYAKYSVYSIPNCPITTKCTIHVFIVNYSSENLWIRHLSKAFVLLLLFFFKNRRPAAEKSKWYYPFQYMDINFTLNRNPWLL